MNVVKTNLPGVLIIEPQTFSDERGYFLESFNEEKYRGIGISNLFVQDNESFSHKNVIRGLHFQLPPFAQGKLIRVIRGKVLDVALDCRPGSPTFGQHAEVILSGQNKLQFWIPRGFAHGFSTLTSGVIFDYKCDNYYSRQHEVGIIYNDSNLNIDWKVKSPIVSTKDLENKSFFSIKSMLE